MLLTDVWVSMGEPDDVWAERIELLAPYQVNAETMAATGNPDVEVHALPAGVPRRRHRRSVGRSRTSSGGSRSRSPRRSSSPRRPSSSTRRRTGCTASRQCSSRRWPTEMRVVVALGGNALLRRGEPLTAQNQRVNVRAACRSLAPLAADHELVISHGNGPQVGSARAPGVGVQGGRPVPVGRPRRADRGHDRLPDPAGARQPAPAGRADHVPADHDRGRQGRPRVRQPDQAHRPDLHRGRGRRPWPRRRAGRSSRTATTCAAWSPRLRREGSSGSSRSSGCSSTTRSSPAPAAAASPSCTPTPRCPAGRELVGVEAVIDKDHASALLALDLDADALLIVTDVDAVYTGWGTADQHAIRRATPSQLSAADVRGRVDGAEGPSRLLVRRTDGEARSDRLHRRHRGACCTVRPGRRSPPTRSAQGKGTWSMTDVGEAQAASRHGSVGASTRDDGGRGSRLGRRRVA